MREQQNTGCDLIGRERIRGANRVIPEGTKPENVTADQASLVASDVETFRRAHKIELKQIAETLGYALSSISEFLKGKHAGGQLAIDLDAWLIEAESHLATQGSTQFVWTNLAQTIQALAGYALDHRTIAMAYGPLTAGMGKTMALRATYETLGDRRCAFVTLNKTDGNPTALLKKLLTALHCEVSGSTCQRFERLVKKLQGRSHLLILDQVHNLRFSKHDKPFYILADLFDATKTAQLWCGTSDLVAYFDRQRAREVDESLAQIRRRIYPCVDLLEAIGGSGGTGAPLTTVEQIRAIFARNKLRIVGSAARFLCRLANTPDSGSLGLCVRLVEYATMLGGLRGLPEIDVPMLKEALRTCMSSARADLLIRGIDEPEGKALIAASAG